MAATVGIVLALAAAQFARRSGLDRDRAFYATIVIVVASYYVLFASMAGSFETIAIEATVMAGFTAAAVIGFKSSPWIVAAALFGHGVFDAAHGLLIENTGMPSWWPWFCGSYDVTAALALAWSMRAQLTASYATRSAGHAR